MRILLLGPQGSGKGTIAKKISQELNMNHIDVGNILRSVPPSHPRYDELNKYMSAGELVPQDFVATLIKEHIAEIDPKDGYIFDGWGRSLEDLKHFDPNYDFVIVFELPREISIKRITGRRICSTNNKVYNIFTLPKEELLECDGELVQREDDTEEAVNRRLDIYYSETSKVIAHFESQAKVIRINAEPLPDEIVQNTISALKSRL